MKNCRLCKKLEGLHFPAPTTSELPEFRMDGGRAFRNTGVDFCGPLYVFDIYEKQRVGMNKAYVALYTCATSRMIHLELVPSLTSWAGRASQR